VTAWNLEHPPLGCLLPPRGLDEILQVDDQRSLRRSEGFLEVLLDREVAREQAAR